jgi:hypothetical protein
MTSQSGPRRAGACKIVGSDDVANPNPNLLPLAVVLETFPPLWYFNNLSYIFLFHKEKNY